MGSYWAIAPLVANLQRHYSLKRLKIAPPLLEKHTIASPFRRSIYATGVLTCVKVSNAYIYIDNEKKFSKNYDMS